MSKEYLVQNWGKVDFRDALAWVKARPVDDLATFAWKLGLPAYEMEGFEINAHVDWLYSLDPEPDAKIERHFVEQVVEGMMGWNPTAVTDCLIRKELVSHALVTPILTKMNMFYWPGPNRALEPEDWRENAAMLLRNVLKSGDESAESLRSCVEVFDCPKEVAEFVEEVIKQP